MIFIYIHPTHCTIFTSYILLLSIVFVYYSFVESVSVFLASTRRLFVGVVTNSSTLLPSNFLV